MCTIAQKPSLSKTSFVLYVTLSGGIIGVVTQHTRFCMLTLGIPVGKFQIQAMHWKSTEPHPNIATYTFTLMGLPFSAS